MSDHCSQITTDHLDKHEPEERNRVYKMLDLAALPHAAVTLRSSRLLAGTSVEIT